MNLTPVEEELLMKVLEKATDEAYSRLQGARMFQGASPYYDTEYTAKVAAHYQAVQALLLKVVRQVTNKEEVARG